MLGARIAALRRQAGLSQAELARRLQISPSAMGMYEQGRREPAGQTLVALARELEVTTDYLLTGQPGTPREAAGMEQLLLDRFRSADARLKLRPNAPITREEAAVLLAALLLE